MQPVNEETLCRAALLSVEGTCGLIEETSTPFWEAAVVEGEVYLMPLRWDFRVSVEGADGHTYAVDIAADPESALSEWFAIPTPQ